MLVAIAGTRIKCFGHKKKIADFKIFLPLFYPLNRLKEGLKVNEKL